MGRRWKAVRRELGLLSRHRRDGRHNYGFLTLILAVSLTWGGIHTIQSRLRPVVEAAAQMQIHDIVTETVQQTVLRLLDSLTYGDLTVIQRGNDGRIVSLTADTLKMNRLRAELEVSVLEAVRGLRTAGLAVPVGSLLHLDLFWGRGPSIQLRSLWVGTVEASFDSEFDSAGVNQTRHRIWLELQVPVQVMLPGGMLETTVVTRLLAAETIIVGQVPDAYLEVTKQ